MKLFNKFHLLVSLNEQKEIVNTSCLNLEELQADGLGFSVFIGFFGTSVEICLKLNPCKLKGVGEEKSS